VPVLGVALVLGAEPVLGVSKTLEATGVVIGGMSCGAVEEEVRNEAGATDRLEGSES
jgi:hypothetical protein